MNSRSAASWRCLYCSIPYVKAVSCCAVSGISGVFPVTIWFMRITVCSGNGSPSFFMRATVSLRSSFCTALTFAVFSAKSFSAFFSCASSFLEKSFPRSSFFRRKFSNVILAVCCGSIALRNFLFSLSYTLRLSFTKSYFAFSRSIFCFASSRFCFCSSVAPTRGVPFLMASYSVSTSFCTRICADKNRSMPFSPIAFV